MAQRVTPGLAHPVRAPRMSAVSPAMRARMLAELDRIGAEENVVILIAAERGSRAWGFHSADRDYDVRFV